jgi:hypothetical protein
MEKLRFNQEATKLKKALSACWVVSKLEAITHKVFLDGEIVALDENGKPHFDELQKYKRTLPGVLRFLCIMYQWVRRNETYTA